MNPKSMEAIKVEMKRMATRDERFRVVYNFFEELGTVDKKGFLIVCRAKMPFVADKMIEVMPSATQSPIVRHMKGVHYLADEEVVALSAAFLKTIIETVKMAVESK